jgi:hypothetical protein
VWDFEKRWEEMDIFRNPNLIEEFGIQDLLIGLEEKRLKLFDRVKTMAGTRILRKAL